MDQPLTECLCGSRSIQNTFCSSPGRTSRGTRNIINQHLRTIRVLEERLAAKENDVRTKDEALKEATEDLARDERIFAEKVHLLITCIMSTDGSCYLLGLCYRTYSLYTHSQMTEIKALKKLARDLSNEKEALIQKTENDAAMISRMSEQALAKEDELGRLRLSLETLQSGRPDAFVINGAIVPGVPMIGMNAKGNDSESLIDNSENADEVIG